MDDDAIRTAGWEAISPFSPQLARLYGLPDAQCAYRKLVGDGTLIVVVGHDTNGYAFALSHCAHFDADVVVPGRFPTFAEVYAARRVLVPEDVLMVAVLEPMTFALRLRWERVHSPAMLPAAPGLPTTVKSVQMFCEGLTEDCVFGTRDIPTPTPVVPLREGSPPPPVPIPDELLGDADAAALDAMADADDEDDGLR